MTNMLIRLIKYAPAKWLALICCRPTTSQNVNKANNLGFSICLFSQLE